MSKFVMIAIQIMQTNFTRNSSDNPAGKAKLTITSTTIGATIYREIKREPVPWNMQVRLGDLFIEAFYNCGFIDLTYCETRDGNYWIVVKKKWRELGKIPTRHWVINLKNTYFEKPDDITANVQAGRERPLIKDKHNNENFNSEAPFARATNKLQQTAWKLNRSVLVFLHKHRNFFAPVEEEDNEAKEARRISKCVEYAFIKKKGLLTARADEFYQTMEIDYRGRLYYAEPFFNFQGSDMARSLFLFAEGKELDNVGQWWLAVHTATSYNQSYDINEIPAWCEADYKSYLEEQGLESISVDKMTLEDRVRWTNENMDVIIEAGRTYYLFEEAEKPVAFFAACREWYNFSEGQTISHLPIPIDGSNNGWQHLGAISKDPLTGRLVGLEPVEIQQDFYVQTAKELYNLTTDERLKSILDAMPMKHIRKGISKRGSMTRAYSAGAAKIGENMWFDCRTEDFHEKYGITEEDCNKFAKILVKAIDNVCPGPLQTMEYLQNLATYQLGKFEKFCPDGEKAGSEYNAIKKRYYELIKLNGDKTDEEWVEMSNLKEALDSYESRLVYGKGAKILEWQTPSGFHVTYPCYQQADLKQRGTISGFKTKAGKARTINHVAKTNTDRPDVRGFVCGISPNFIHSLDASHMALVIDRWDGSFGAVHDSFSAHACDIDELLNLTKHVFIEMYAVDNYYDIIRWRLTQDEDDIDPPQLGQLDIMEVNNSDYFFA